MTPNPNEKVYIVTKKKPFAMKWRVEQFKMYLDYDKFTVITIIHRYTN